MINSDLEPLIEIILEKISEFQELLELYLIEHPINTGL